MKRILALLVGSLAACSVSTDRESSEREPTQRIEHVASPIIHGTDSVPAEDAVVLIMHYDAIKVGGDTFGCSGTMLTPRLVLTARHCVAQTDPSAACDSNGNAVVGGMVAADQTASKLYAFAGTKRPDFISGLDKASRGQEIIDDASMTLCNHDLALILLEKPLEGAKTAPVRLDDGPRKDETMLVVGWGVTDKTPMPETRQQRGGVKVLQVGPAPQLGPSEFILGESGCAGDSGGPAFAESSGAVVGVLSRGGNATGADPGDVAGCLNAQNVFTSAASFGDLIRSAYEKAGQDPWLEGQPDPTTLPPKPPEEKSSGCAMGDTSKLARGGAGPTGQVAPFAFAFLVAALVACVRRRLSRS